MSDNMSVNQLLGQIRSIREQTSVGNIGRVDAPNNTEKVDFGAMLNQSISSVNATQKQAAALSAAFSRGDSDVSLTEVMVNAQKSEVSFKALMEVRNKFVDAYQEVMRMSL